MVARPPAGGLLTRKLLSEDPARYEDAAVEGVRRLLALEGDEPLPAELVAEVRMGTTVATNALLERAGSPTLYVTTRGFGDALRIGYQDRPDIFALDIRLPEPAYARVLEVDERVGADGAVVRPLDEDGARRGLEEARRAGLDAVAIAFMHGYAYPEHERRVAELARAAGFSQVSVSHETSPLMKLVGRGETTVVDAYLSPILRHYVDGVAAQLGGVRLRFMQSHGGLTDAGAVSRQGRDPLRAGGRRRRRRRREPPRRLRQAHRLRHGRHLHRREPLRRRAGAQLRERGRRRAPARADAAHAHGGRGRRLGLRLRERALPGRPAQRRRRPRAGVLRQAAGRSPSPTAT